ncbi:hypothetical protein NXW84_12410 [Bacteroides fragilis]|nr:hypothetical protein NXW84_12410 [Bacteroides fragilis]
MKNSLCNSVSSVVKKLLEYGEDGTPVYVNELIRVKSRTP